MYRIIMLAALIVSVIGGLWLMSGSAPLAAQTLSATRSFNPATVAPNGEVAVSIVITGSYGLFGSVTERLPAGFTYVRSDDFDVADDAVTVTGQDVEFFLQGEEDFTYVVTASGTAGVSFFHRHPEGFY